MGKNKVMNLFEKAIEKGELLSFSLGKKNYFIVDREYDEHSILSSWTNHILPLYIIKGEEYVNSKVMEMMTEVISSNLLNEQQKAENLLYHLHVYYYLGSEGRLNAKSFKEINREIEECFSNYLKSISDKNKIKSFKRAIELIKSRGGLIIPKVI